MKLFNKEILRKKQKNSKEKNTLDQYSYLMIDDQDDSQVTKRVGDLKSFKMLYSFAKPYKKEISFSLFLVFASTVCAIVSSRFLGNLVQDGLATDNVKVTIHYISIVIVFEFLFLVLNYYGTKQLIRAASDVVFSIRQKLFEKLQNLPMQYYDRQPQGRIVTRVTHDVEGIESFFTSSLVNLISSLLITLMSLIAMLMANFHLGLIMLLAIVPNIIYVIYLKDVLRTSNRRVSRTSSAIYAKLSEHVNGIETIRIYGLEKWSLTHFRKCVDDFLHFQLKANLIYAFSMPLLALFISIPLVTLVWFGGKGVLEGVYSVGLFISFVRLYERFSSPLMTLSREINTVQEAFTNTERVLNFLSEDEEDDVFLKEDNRTIGEVKGDIKFNDVWMKYTEGDWILKGLSFHIKQGEKIGFVGRTGCGKSTTVSLLSRLYEYQKGEVLIDDVSIRNYNRNFLRSKIGFVSQDAIIFKGTLKENLSSDDTLSDAEIMKAARRTGLAQSLAKEGFNLQMEILENGANLSVGQKQLLSLTRVLILNPSILILDEATANIDPHYEAIIQEAVFKIMEGRTCIMIAHRLDTLNECDRVFVFNSGELVEEGTLNHLFESKGYFYQLHHAKQLNS